MLKDAVRAAHDEGARVTAHCFAEDTLDDMLDAGIDCIEHATGLLPRHLPRFVEQGVPIVPTLINIATFPDIAAQAEAKFPRYAAHMRASGSAGQNVSVRPSKPASPSTPARTPAASSNTGASLTKSRRCTPPGCRPRAALDAGAWAARDWLGAPGITDGASADVLVCAEDPRGNLAALQELRHIVLRGELVR